MDQAMADWSESERAPNSRYRNVLCIQKMMEKKLQLDEENWRKPWKKGGMRRPYIIERVDGDSGRLHRWERPSLKDHVADLKNGGGRRLAGRRVPFTCEKIVSKQYVRNAVIYSRTYANEYTRSHPSALFDSTRLFIQMASFAMLPLMDASRDSRIHDWIAEQYSFALSEFQDDYLSRDDPPSLRESKLLPDDFDILTRPPPRPQRDTDSDRDSQSTHSCDPPLLPSPLPLLHDAPPDITTSQDSTDLEDAFHGLLREMNSWRFLPASRSALTLTLSDRNKVRSHCSVD